MRIRECGNVRPWVITVLSLFVVFLGIPGIGFADRPHSADRIQKDLGKKVDKLSKDKRYKDHPTYQRMDRAERMHVEGQFRERKAGEDNFRRSADIRKDELEKKAGEFQKADKYNEHKKAVDSLAKHPDLQNHSHYQKMTHEDKIKLEHVVDRTPGMGEGDTRDSKRLRVLKAMEENQVRVQNRQTMQPMQRPTKPVRNFDE